MKIYSKLFLISLVTLTSTLILTTKLKINAQVSYTTEKYNVDIEIEEDTTFIVTENIRSRFTGNFHGLRADIPLINNLCSTPETSNRTCGGFEMILPIGIYDEDGKLLTEEDGASVYEFSEEDSSEKFIRFEWEQSSGGTDIINESKEWTIKYQVIGGIGLIGSTRQNSDLYFYWNILGRQDGSSIDSSEISIQFPESVNLSDDNLTTYGSFRPQINLNRDLRRIEINLENLIGYEDFTASYKFEDSELQKPGILEYEVIKPNIGTKLYFNDKEIFADSKDTFNLFPAGKNELEFRHFGYEPDEITVNMKENGSENLSITLDPKPLMKLVLFANYFITIIGIALIPAFIFRVYKKHKSSGTDKNAIKTIVPQFSPPENIKPYLLGSLKDEKVDFRDITGTIIDLAYRGYIKIKEEKGDNFELTKLEVKDGDTKLTLIEKELLDIIFASNNPVKTSSFDYNFSLKMKGLISKVYKEMVDQKYFEKSPEDIRSKYMGQGIGIMLLGIALTIGISILLSNLLGVSSIFTSGIALAAMGIAFIFAAPHMPAKTELGSKVFNQILGFRMYLQTAERFRLKDLTPDEFEKYLSYAVVTNVEKEWAESFKSIYTKNPEWYQGTRDITDSLYISRSLRNFSNVTEKKIRTLQSQAGKYSSGSRGGGWRGSLSSFGGFSGGGGGGGSRGGW
jgi:uncharacterized membrane protein YgcG